jgi:transcription termination/antitermination protein NusG
MSDETPVDTATAPTDEKAETPAHVPAPAEPVPNATPEAAAPTESAPEGAVPEAEASVEQVTAPDPEAAPEPEPAAPPEVAEVAAAVATLNEQQEQVAEPEPAHAELPAEAPDAETAPESETEALAPVEEPETEALVPVQEPEAAVAEKAEDEKPAKSKKSRAKAAKSAPDATVTEEPTGTVTPAEEPAEPKPENKKKWYAVKVQSGREDTIKAAILRKVAIEGLEEFFGGIEIPVEEVIEKKQVRVKDKKTGDYTTQERKVTKKKKKFHGYIFANVEFNDRILYLFRETSGVGDFLNVRGSPGAPVAEPMPEHEVRAMLTGEKVKDPNKPVKVKLDFDKGDKVRIREGSFANQEGEVKEIHEPKDPTDSTKIKVILTFWGRPLEVDLDHWQVEKV